MKTLAPWLLSLALATALVFVYNSKESTNRELREEIVDLKKTSSSASGRRLSQGGQTAGNRTAISSGPRSPQNGIQKSSDADLGESLRKIMENPIGKAMMSEEGRIKASRIYRDLIKEMNLSDEEEEYFTGLLAADVGAEDATGMQLFNAKTDEERLAILDNMEAAKEERKQEIKDFLNNEEDFSRFRHYQDRRREYEQLSTVRSAISSSGTPLTEPQEEQLVEAMYASRNESGMARDWEGREGMQQFARPGVSDRFTADWEKMQGILSAKTGDILDEPQQMAFSAQQTQMRDLALFGIKMAEGMIQSKQNENSGEDGE